MAYFIPPRPSAEAINWHVCVTDCLEIYTLFAQHVQFDCATSDTNACFPSFGKLPIELQIHVLRFCSRATLFRLMQTSATLRREASKLFWSDPDCWYHVDGTWLLAGGFAGEAHYATNFLCWVQQIEIIFEDVRTLLGLDNKRETEEKERPAPKQDQRIGNFWRVIQRRFPRAVRVVISENSPRRSRSVSLKNVQRVVQGCPNGMEASISIMSSGDGTTGIAKRYRARFDELAMQWKVMEEEWIRQSILPPAKAWRGPVGEYAQSEYEWKRFMGMKRARHILLVEAIERAYFSGQGKGFQCPGIRCEEYFVDGRQWTTHAIAKGHFMYAEAPVAYQEQFARHEDMVKRGFEEKVDRAQKRIGEVYKKAKDEQKKEMKQAFLEQLRSDADYAQSKAVEESDLWKLYRVCIGDANLYEVFKK